MKRKTQRNPSSLANLIDRSAPDRPGETITTAVRLRADDAEWLRTLPEGSSYHVRQAVKLYRQQLEGVKVGANAE
jgi:hypothetical protein